MLTDRRTLENHGSRLHGLPTSRDLLLCLEQALVSPLADWSFMSPWKHMLSFSTSLIFHFFLFFFFNKSDLIFVYMVPALQHIH